MTEDSPARRTRGWAGAILRAVHFWVPVAVLAGGLFVLQSIH